MLNRLYALTLSVVLFGMFRAGATLAVDRYWWMDLDRLALEASYQAAVGRSMWISSCVATVAAIGAALLIDTISARMAGSRRPRGAVAEGTVLAAFWGVVAVREIVDRTTSSNMMTARIQLTEAHAFIFVIAVVGAAISLVFSRRVARMSGAQGVLAITATVVIWLSFAHGLGAAAERMPVPGDDPRPNVVLITIDTLRADHLSSYGYERRTSPHIDAIASRGILYENAIAQAPNTHPSTAAIMTSRYPSDLGNNPFKYIPYPTVTLAEGFRNAGYRTAAVVSNVWLRASMGFDQGFEHFDDQTAMSEFYADGERVAWKNASHVSDAAIAWLTGGAREPFFLWLHYLDPHHPYEPPSEYRELFTTSYRENEEFLNALASQPTEEQSRMLTDMGLGRLPVTDAQFAAIVDQYDGEIAYTDAQVGRVLDYLDSLGEPTIVAVTADHGEEFRDHGGWGHSHTLHREVLNVPLIIAFAGVPGGERVPATVRLIDVAPTLLARAGIAKPVGMRGTNLLPITGDRPALSMLTRLNEVSIEVGDDKLISDLARTRPRLYAVKEDPHERVDRAATEPERVAALYALLDRTMGGAFRVEQTDATASQLDESTRKQLKALGYID